MCFGQSYNKQPVGLVQRVGRALDCRARGREFDPWGRTNTQGLKNNQDTAFALQEAGPSHGSDEIHGDANEVRFSLESALLKINSCPTKS